LYLDTARLGRTSPTALAAQLDFVRLTAEEPASLYFEKFLQHGTRVWEKSRHELFSGLHRWNGIAGLKQKLADIAGFPSSPRVLLSGQSTPLVELAAHMLSKRCCRILTTDLNWPAWQETIERIARRSHIPVVVVPIRDAILNGSSTLDDVVRLIREQFCRDSCDGLFLPAVDNLGIRMPVRTIVRSIRERADLRFCVVDGAQAVGHVPAAISDQDCDLFLAGCHKWIGAYQPLRVAIAPNRRTQAVIMQTIRDLMRAGELQDSLLSFTEQLDSGTLDGISETTNLTPLFAARGAAREFQRNASRWGPFRRQLRNARQVRSLARQTGWIVHEPHEGFLTGIVVIHSADDEVRSLPPEILRQRLHDAGVIATTYAGGSVRLSMPRHDFRRHEVQLIVRALQSVSRHGTSLGRHVDVALPAEIPSSDVSDEPTMRVRVNRNADSLSVPTPIQSVRTA
jgi:aspartate aminotransferase-like enzyme